MSRGQAAIFCSGCGRDVAIAIVGLDADRSVVRAEIYESTEWAWSPSFGRIRLLQDASKPAWVTQEIVRLKALMPDTGCRTITLVFNRRYAHHADVRRRMTVGKSFVADTIRKQRYEIMVIRRRIKHRVPPPLPRNLIWGLDLTGKRDVAGETHTILGLVDHGSRGLLTLAALPDKCTWTCSDTCFWLSANTAHHARCERITKRASPAGCFASCLCWQVSASSAANCVARGGTDGSSGCSARSRTSWIGWRWKGLLQGYYLRRWNWLENGDELPVFLGRAA